MRECAKCGLCYGDDVEIWGLHVSPDLDTLVYALAGRLDVSRGWGLSGETFRCLEGMADLGAETWFNLGDQDLATHLYRTGRMAEGARLSTVTAEITAAFGLELRLLPMTDDTVRTIVTVPVIVLMWPAGTGVWAATGVTPATTNPRAAENRSTPFMGSSNADN